MFPAPGMRALSCLSGSSPPPTSRARRGRRRPEAAITFNLLSVEGLVIGKTLTIDQAFGDQHAQGPVAVLLRRAAVARQGIRGLRRTGPEARRGVDQDQLRHPRSPAHREHPVRPPDGRHGGTQERQQALAATLVDRGLAIVLAGKANTGRDVRAIKIGDYDAVEVIGHYDEPDLGTMYARLVGILNPDGRTASWRSPIRAVAGAGEDDRRFRRRAAGRFY